jgi:hypothetical protein
MTMEWLQSALTQEPFILLISISIIVSIFIFAARKAHTNHLARMKKIDETFNPKEKYHH